MDNAQIYAALSAVVRMARLNLQQQAATRGATQVISCAALLPDSQAHTPPARQSTTTDNTVWGPDTLPSAWEVV